MLSKEFDTGNVQFAKFNSGSTDIIVQNGHEFKYELFIWN